MSGQEWEEWRTVPGHPDYEVSSLGNVRSWKGCRNDGIPSFPRMLKCGPDPAGYPRTALDFVKYNVHRLVAAAWYGPCPEGMEVDHINGVRDDNRVENLRYVSRQENMAKLRGRLAELCKRGHPLSGDNLYVWHDVKKNRVIRQCRICNDYRAKNRPKSDRPCTAIDGCSELSTCQLRSDKPLCEMHYQRERAAKKRQTNLA